MIETDYPAEHDGGSDPEFACLFWPGEDRAICEQSGRPPGPDIVAAPFGRPPGPDIVAAPLAEHGWPSVWDFLAAAPVCERCLTDWVKATRPPAARLPDAVTVAMGGQPMEYRELTAEHLEALWRRGKTLGEAAEDFNRALRKMSQGLASGIEDAADTLSGITDTMTSHVMVRCTDGERRTVVPAHLTPDDVDEESGEVRWPPSDCPADPCPSCED